MVRSRALWRTDGSTGARVGNTTHQHPIHPMPFGDTMKIDWLNGLRSKSHSQVLDAGLQARWLQCLCVQANDDEEMPEASGFACLCCILPINKYLGAAWSPRSSLRDGCESACLEWQAEAELEADVADAADGAGAFEAEAAEARVERGFSLGF